MANKVEQMRAFRAVVETGGFTSAAGVIGMSKAAVSRHVLDLEDRLGVRLLNRTTRQMNLTEVGGAFYEKSCRILEEIEQAERSVSDSSAGPQGALRVVAPVNFGLSDLGEAVVAFLREFPDIRLDLSLNDQTIDPMEGGYDIAIRVRLSEPQVPKTLDIHRISRSTRMLCASPDYLESYGAPASAEALADHQCLSYSYVDDPETWRLSRDGREYVIPVTSRIVTSARHVITSAAEQGLGIAYGPAAFFRGELADGKLVQVLPDYELPRATIFSLSARSRYTPAKIGAFNRFMEDFFVGRIF